MNKKIIRHINRRAKRSKHGMSRSKIFSTTYELLRLAEKTKRFTRQNR